MYFSPPLPQSVFMKMLFLTSFTLYCLSLCDKVFSCLIKFQAVQSQHFKFPDIVLAYFTAVLDKSNF